MGEWSNAVKERYEVWHGKKHHTKGGLTKDKLTKNKRGKLVSKRASQAAKMRKNLGHHQGKGFTKKRVRSRSAKTGQRMLSGRQ